MRQTTMFTNDRLDARAACDLQVGMVFSYVGSFDRYCVLEPPVADVELPDRVVVVARTCGAGRTRHVTMPIRLHADLRCEIWRVPSAQDAGDRAGAC